MYFVKQCATLVSHDTRSSLRGMFNVESCCYIQLYAVIFSDRYDYLHLCMALKFLHLADHFFQGELHCIQAIYLYSCCPWD